MSWHDGALQSWYDIHEALGKEIQRLNGVAADVSADDAAGLETLSDDVVFLADVLTVHSLSEDGVGFPILRRHGVDIPLSLTEDHHRELTLLYDIRRACIEVRYHEEGQDVAPAFTRVRDLLKAMEADLLAHNDVEDEQIIPRAAEALSPEDQIKLVVMMVAHTPAWLNARILPWMVATIALDHRRHLLTAWHEAMPPDVFAAKVRVIRDGADDALWSELVAEVPALGLLD